MGSKEDKPFPLYGYTKTGKQRRIKPGTRKPTGRPFPKKGVDPKFDSERAAQLSRIHAKGNEAQMANHKRRRKMFDRVKYWSETVEEYIKDNPDAGKQTLKACDAMLMDPEISSANKKEVLKIKMQILGLAAPAAPAQEQTKEDEAGGAQTALDKLQSLGIDTGDVAVLEDGKIVKAEEDD